MTRKLATRVGVAALLSLVTSASSLAVSAADMERFMIAHLDQGAGLMQPATAQLMHDPARRGHLESPASGVPALAALVVLDVMLTFHLISFGTNF
jgi:hypothetical protein